MLETLKRKWHAGSSTRFTVPFADYSARFKYCRDDGRRAIEFALALRTDAEAYDYAEATAAEIARLSNIPQAVGTDSGTSALAFALQALDLPRNSKILVPAHTYVATELAARAAGLEPVWVDCAEDDPHPGVEQYQSALVSGVRAVVAVHLFGGMGDMKGLARWCAEKGLPLIEDACQAQGLEGAGTYGLAAAFSLNPTKICVGLGNGGLLVSKVKSIRDAARRLRDPESSGPGGRTPAYLDPLQAGFAAAQAKVLPKILQHHAALAAAFTSEVGLPLERPHTYYRLVVGVPDPAKARAALKRSGVDARPRLYKPLSRPGECPNAESYWSRSLAMPIGLHLAEEDMRRAAAGLRPLLEKRENSSRLE